MPGQDRNRRIGDVDMDLTRKANAKPLVAGVQGADETERMHRSVAWDDGAGGVRNLSPDTIIRFEHWLCKALFGASGVQVAAADLVVGQVAGFRFSGDDPTATPDAVVCCHVIRCGQVGRRVLEPVAAMPRPAGHVSGPTLSADQLCMLIEAGFLQRAGPPERCESAKAVWQRH